MKSIIIYFSRADENYGVGLVEKGNTEKLAEYITELTHADMFKVERKVPYAKDYKTCCDQALEEQQNNLYPELLKNIDNINDYDVVFIGSPVYWGTLPRPMFTALKNLNWSFKKVLPFITHEGSGSADIPSDLNKICVGADVRDPLVVRGSKVDGARSEVEEWLKHNNI